MTKKKHEELELPGEARQIEPDEELLLYLEGEPGWLKETLQNLVKRIWRFIALRKEGK